MNLTDDEMRVKIAELYGWDDIRERALKAKGWHETGITGGALDYCGVPDYLNNLNAALTLCDRLREEICNVNIAGHGYYDIWFVTISRPSEEFKVADPSLARAICLAFLKVKGEAK